MTLCSIFQSLSQRVWNDRKEGLRLSLDPSETTISENLLLELAQKHPNQIVVQKFTAHEESRVTGADWDWWFVGKRQAWSMRIQAKKFDVAKLTYRGIDYPHTKFRKRQIASLLRSAQNDNIYPAYCFYNYERTGQFAKGWRCVTSPVNELLMGCTIADAHIVRGLQKRRKWTLNDILPISMPWHCLVCCPQIHGPGVGPKSVRDWAIEFLNAKNPPDVIGLDVAPLYVRRMYESHQHSIEIDPQSMSSASGVVVVRMTES